MCHKLYTTDKWFHVGPTIFPPGPKFFSVHGPPNLYFNHWVTAPCNVACGSGIMTVNTSSGSTLQCNGSGMTCHWIRPNVRHIGILHLVSIPTHHHSRHVILYAKCEILSKSDHRRQKKMTSCRFSRWRISAILDCGDPIMGSLKSPVKLT